MADDASDDQSPLSDQQQDVLRRQVIDETAPGTVLRDFETLLDLVGPRGIEVGAAQQLLPIKQVEQYLCSRWRWMTTCGGDLPCPRGHV